MSIGWARSLVQQCASEGVPCFVKQLGAHPRFSAPTHIGRLRSRKGGDPSEWPEDLRVRQWPQVRP